MAKWVNVQMLKEVKFNGQTYKPGDPAVMRESMAKAHVSPGEDKDPLLVILGDAPAPLTVEELQAQEGKPEVPNLGNFNDG
jgi:hypothetical protein